MILQLRGDCQSMKDRMQHWSDTIPLWSNLTEQDKSNAKQAFCDAEQALWKAFKPLRELMRGKGDWAGQLSQCQSVLKSTVNCHRLQLICENKLGLRHSEVVKERVTSWDPGLVMWLY
jgi:hypothetical protein